MKNLKNLSDSTIVEVRVPKHLYESIKAKLKDKVKDVKGKKEDKEKSKK